MVRSLAGAGAGSWGRQRSTNDPGVHDVDYGEPMIDDSKDGISNIGIAVILPEVPASHSGSPSPVNLRHNQICVCIT